MYKIKQLPEDFIVKEIGGVKLKQSGEYSVFLLKKTKYNTEDAIKKLSETLRIERKFFGYAGNKDKQAITEQYISIKTNEKILRFFQCFHDLKTNKKIDLKIKDIELSFAGFSDEPISLGDLEGNEFTITIRNLNNDYINNFNKNKQKKLFPNYFGEQRFSKNNHLIGKAIIKTDFKKAVELILEGKGHDERIVKGHIEKNKSDYVGAIRKIPLKIRTLYVNAYQSFLFNSFVDGLSKAKTWEQSDHGFLKQYNKNKQTKIPVVGFGTEFNNDIIERIYNGILKKQKINLRDFIIKPMPELSSEGVDRDLFMDVKDLELIEINYDELNKNYKKIKIKFTLKKGCYATEVVKGLISYI